MGIGSFIIALSQRAGEGYIIEPVHNIFLLAGSELGILAFNYYGRFSPRIDLLPFGVVGVGCLRLHSDLEIEIFLPYAINCSAYY